MPIHLANGGDDEGALLFEDGLLVAVMSRLAPDHGNRGGHWYVECSFGAVQGCHRDFKDLGAACDMLEAALHPERDLGERDLGES
jgi:hypothetical protein